MVVSGNEEDLQAFLMGMRHIDYLQMVGSSRDVTFEVDGDGSASLHCYIDNREDEPFNPDADHFSPVEYSSENMQVIRENEKKWKEKEQVHFGILGTVEADLNASFSIGE
jgi:hypothetical protein